MPSSACALFDRSGCKGGARAHFSEQSRPYWLYVFNIGRFDESLEFVGLTIHQLRFIQEALPSPSVTGNPERTVTSTPSSAKMRAAYDVASSELDMTVFARGCEAGMSEV